MFFGLIAFGVSLEKLGVTDADCRTDLNSQGTCTNGWYAQLPSATIEGKEHISCRICPDNSAMFSMSESCSFGWGGILVVVACIMCFVAAAVGHCVTPRHQEWGAQMKARIAARRGRSKGTRYGA